MGATDIGVCACGHPAVHHDSDGQCINVHCGCFDLTPAPVAEPRTSSQREEPTLLGEVDADLGFAARIFELLDRWSPGQRSQVFYEIETRWCWDCGWPQADAEVHEECSRTAPQPAPTREQVETRELLMLCYVKLTAKPPHDLYSWPTHQQRDWFARNNGSKDRLVERLRAALYGAPQGEP